MFATIRLQKSVDEGILVMPRNLLGAVARAAFFALAFARSAEAGVGGGAGEVLSSVRYTAPIEKAQYDVFDNDNYCWYDDGWQGAGWYLCGEEWDNGVGWGGPFGWNGWGGGGHIWRHRHPHPEPPKHGRDHGPRPPVGPGGGPFSHTFRNGPGSTGVGSGSSPIFGGFHGGGAAPPSLGSGGGGAFHGFGGGGGGIFSPGGHGGHGR